MEKEVFKVMLLMALPASGKSEVRNFMANIEAERLKKDFHIGENLQLDDFPYVFMMRRIDEELVKLNQPRMFYPGEEPFYDGRDWGTLCNLLNEDYHDLINRTQIKVNSAAEYLFERIDRASLAVGLKPRLDLLDESIRKKLAEALETEAQELINNKVSQYCDSLDGKTIVIEMARGGNDGASMPLTGTFGYQYTLAQFCPEILKNAAILYIWVTPEESRRKNNEREDPNNPGSNLNHKTPDSVMYYDYGCDDMQYLIETSEVKDTVTVKTHGQTYHLPIGVFDNRVDKTTTLRQSPDKWDSELVKELTEAINIVTNTMWKNY